MNATCFHCGNKHDNMDQFYICAANHGFRSHKTLQPAEPVRELRPVKRTEEKREEQRRQLLADIRKVGAGVPEGNYALRNQGGPNDISFYKVFRMRNGGTMVLIYASDDERKLSWERQLDVLVRISQNIEAALTLYGLSTKRCGHCSRKLTTKESRERGIGPVCARALGFRAA